MVKDQFPTNFKYKNNSLKLREFKELFSKISISSFIVIDRVNVLESLLLVVESKNIYYGYFFLTMDYFTLNNI